MGEIGNKYAKFRPTKDFRQEPATKKKCVRHQEKNYKVQHAVDEIILQEKENLSVKDETYENIDDEVDEDELYELEK